jgi:hypothetical protein
MPPLRFGTGKSHDDIGFGPLANADGHIIVGVQLMQRVGVPHLPQKFRRRNDRRLVDLDPTAPCGDEGGERISRLAGDRDPRRDCVAMAASRNGRPCAHARKDFERGGNQDPASVVVMGEQVASAVNI